MSSRRIAVRAWIVCGALGVAGSALAEEKQSLSLNDAVRRAEDASPIVRRARADKRVVEAGRVGAKALLSSNPYVSGTVGYRRDSSGSLPPATGVEWGVHVEQAFEIAGQRGRRRVEVERAVDVADARIDLALLETRARARLQYIGVRIAEAQLDSAKKREELGARLYHSASERVRAGAASEVELRLAEIERGKVEQERVEAELAQMNAESALRLSLDLPRTGSIELSTPLAEPEAPKESLEELIDLAKRQRADLLVLERTRGQLDATLARLRREIVPNPALWFDGAGQQPGQLYLGGGLGLALPIFQNQQGARAIAAGDKARNEEERVLVLKEAEREVADAYRAVFSYRSQVAVWRGKVIPAAEASVELISQGWRAGKFDLFRVIQASREAGEARRRGLEVLGALWAAVVQLQRTTGTK